MVDGAIFPIPVALEIKHVDRLNVHSGHERDEKQIISKHLLTNIMMRSYFCKYPL